MYHIYLDGAEEFQILRQSSKNEDLYIFLCILILYTFLNDSNLESMENYSTNLAHYSEA